jgi:outer membrane lipoprotein carrier protein
MTHKKLIQSALLTLSLLLSQSVLAADSASEKLTIFLQSVVTFKAQFEQVVLGPQGEVIETAQGQFILERPGKFRWDYLNPYPQEIVADGTRIWFYDVDLEQVTVQPQKEALTDTPATLLSGEMLPDEKYQVTDLTSDDGYAWVELIPKDAESNFQSVRFAFDDQGLRQMIMRDSFDQYTRLIFSDVSENMELDEKTFVFVPPEGVDVVGDAQL